MAGEIARGVGIKGHMVISKEWRAIFSTFNNLDNENSWHYHSEARNP